MSVKHNNSNEEGSKSYSYSTSDPDRYYSEYSYSSTLSTVGTPQKREQTSDENAKGLNRNQAINSLQKNEANAIESDEYYSSYYSSTKESKDVKSPEKTKSSEEYSYSKYSSYQQGKKKSSDGSDSYYYSYSSSSSDLKAEMEAPAKSTLSKNSSSYSSYSDGSQALSAKESLLTKKSAAPDLTQKRDLLSSDASSGYYSYDYSYSYSDDKECEDTDYDSAYTSYYSYYTSEYSKTQSNYSNKTEKNNLANSKKEKLSSTSSYSYYTYSDDYKSSRKTNGSDEITSSRPYSPLLLSKLKDSSRGTPISTTDSNYYSSYSSYSTKQDEDQREDSYSSSFAKSDDQSYTVSPESSLPVQQKVLKVLLLNQNSNHEEKQYYSSPESSVSITEYSAPKTPREYLVLRAPEQVNQIFDPPPSSNYISQGMPDDFIGNFLKEIDAYHRGTKKCLSSIEKNHSKKACKESDKHSRFSLTQGDSELTLRSVLRSALKVLQINHIERKRISEKFLKLESKKAFENDFRTLIEQQIMKKIVNAFILYDPCNTGELTLEKNVEMLTNLGIGFSPRIGGYRIKVGVKDSLPALIIEYAAFPPGENEKPSTKYFPVMSLLQNKKMGSLPFRFSVSHSRILLGEETYDFVTKSSEDLIRLKKYCISWVFLCTIMAQYTFLDRTNVPCIEYPPLVRALFSATFSKKKLEGHEEIFSSIFLSSAFLAIYNPTESLREYVSLATEKNDNGEMAAESALMATTDLEKKRRRNVVPNVIDSNVVECNTSTNDEKLFEFSIEKVRVQSAVPDDCIPFCLISVVSGDSAFLPALKIGVTNVRTSSKGGYTWTFNTKSQSNTVLVKAKDDKERLYIECCFEKKSVITLNSQTRTDSTVWCAGYATVALSDLRTMTLVVCQGSLLDPPSAEEKEDKPHLSERHSVLKKKTTPASNIKVKINSLSKDTKLHVSALPERCLLLRRQLFIITSLRNALAHLGKAASCAAKAFAHQYARTAFSVSSDTYLLDQLEALWLKKRSELSAKDEKIPHHYALLHCAAAVAASYNCGSREGPRLLSLSKKVELSLRSRNAPISCI